MFTDRNDDPLRKVQDTPSISPIETHSEESKGESGLSSIEKSKSVKPEMVPPMNSPLLTTPSNQESMVFAVASIDSSGFPIKETVRSFVLKGEEIKSSMLEGWMKNLREIEEHVRQLLSSPLYQQLQEIRLKGDPRSGNVSGVQGVTAANAAEQSEQIGFLSALDRLRTLERVPTSAEVSESTPPRDSSQVLILPLTAALLAGGGLAMSTIIDSTNPLGGVIDFVQSLQPLFPTVGVQDLIPVINLMIVGPIYFNSWNEAVSNLSSGEHKNYVQTAQNFAKDVIKIIMDPHFVNSTLISRMKGTDQLSPQDQDRLGRMLKVVLIGVALSLLYSVEVGKVQRGTFGGIEPEELRDLLLGNWNQPPEPGKKTTLQEQLTLSLILRAHEQLVPLSKEDRIAAVNMLLNYVTKPRELDPMLDPAKVFDETLTSTTFKTKDKISHVKG